MAFSASLTRPWRLRVRHLSWTPCLNSTNTAAYCIANNRLDEAKQILRRAFDGGMDSVFLRIIQNNVAFLEGDMLTVQRNVGWAKGRAGSGGLFDGRASM